MILVGEFYFGLSRFHLTSLFAVAVVFCPAVIVLRKPGSVHCLLYS